MKVLIACEFSGRVRDAFSVHGHDAWSCDFLPSETPGQHIQGDVLQHLDGWDLIIAHPPCTDLAVSGARHFAAKIADGRQGLAVSFVFALNRARVERLVIENPVSVLSTLFRKPDQIIHPWQFGHGETKATCLWLRGVQKLRPTAIVAGRSAVVHRMPPGPNRWRDRSRTYPGIAEAMAVQWGGGQ